MKITIPVYTPFDYDAVQDKLLAKLRSGGVPVYAYSRPGGFGVWGHLTGVHRTKGGLEADVNLTEIFNPGRGGFPADLTKLSVVGYRQGADFTVEALHIYFQLEPEICFEEVKDYDPAFKDMLQRWQLQKSEPCYMDPPKVEPEPWL